MTGALPTSPSEREQFIREGKRPFAVKVGGRWVPLTQAQPLSGLIAFGAGLAAESEEETLLGRTGEAATRIAVTGANIMFEAPMMRGLKDIQQAAREGGTADFLRRTTASFVPNILASAARTRDPGVKEIGTLRDAVFARLPFLSDLVPDRLDSLTGEEVVREGEPGSTAFFGLLGVFGSSPDRAADNPILAEMQRIGASVGKLNRRGRETVLQQRARLQRRRNEGDAAYRRRLATEPDRLPAETAEEHRERTRETGSITGSVIAAALFPSSEDDIELLRIAGVLDEAIAYQRLRQGEQTPETLEEQRRLLQKIVTDTRSRITRERRARR